MVGTYFDLMREILSVKVDQLTCVLCFLKTNFLASSSLQIEFILNLLCAGTCPMRTKTPEAGSEVGFNNLEVLRDFVWSIANSLSAKYLYSHYWAMFLQ